MDDNPYVELTTAFNRGRLRAVLSSGQAVVMHRLAVMSKAHARIAARVEGVLPEVPPGLGETT